MAANTTKDKSWVQKTPGVCGGRACIAGHRIRVLDIVVWHEMRGYGADEVVDLFPGITLADVHAALAYYFDHRESILQEMREDEEFVRQLRAAAGPGVLAQRLNALGSAGAPVSS